MKPDWINVNELLPPFGKRVLVWHEEHAMFAVLHISCPHNDGEEHFILEGHKRCFTPRQITSWSHPPRAPYNPIKEIRSTSKPKAKRVNRHWNTYY